MQYKVIYVYMVLYRMINFADEWMELVDQGLLKF